MQRDGSCRYSPDAAQMIAKVLVQAGAYTASRIQSLANTAYVTALLRGVPLSVDFVRDAYKEHTGEDWRE